MKTEIHDCATEKGRKVTLDRISNVILDDKPFLLVSASVDGPNGPELVGICTIKSKEDEQDMVDALVTVMESPGPFNRILSAAVQKCALRIAIGNAGKYKEK